MPDTLLRYFGFSFTNGMKVLKGCVLRLLAPVTMHVHLPTGVRGVREMLVGGDCWIRRHGELVAMRDVCVERGGAGGREGGRERDGREMVRRSCRDSYRQTTITRVERDARCRLAERDKMWCWSLV